MRAAHIRTALQCECPGLDHFLYWGVGSSTSYFLFVRVGTNRLVERLAKTYIDQALYTRVNESLRFLLLFSSQVWPLVKGCGMGPWLVLVSPCFRENVVATCKIGSFLCSLDNLLRKNVIVFFFENQISKWRSFEKRAIFDLLFTFFSHQGKVTKIPSAHISLTYIHIFCSPYWLFLPYQFWKNTNLSGTVSLWCESWCWFLFAPFWNNQ